MAAIDSHLQSAGLRRAFEAPRWPIPVQTLTSGVGLAYVLSNNATISASAAFASDLRTPPERATSSAVS